MQYVADNRVLDMLTVGRLLTGLTTLEIVLAVVSVLGTVQTVNWWQQCRFRSFVIIHLNVFVSSSRDWLWRMWIRRCGRLVGFLHCPATARNTLTLILLTWRIWWAPNNGG